MAELTSYSRVNWPIQENAQFRPQKSNHRSLSSLLCALSNSQLTLSSSPEKHKLTDYCPWTGRTSHLMLLNLSTSHSPCESLKKSLPLNACELEYSVYQLTGHLPLHFGNTDESMPLARREAKSQRGKRTTRFPFRHRVTCCPRSQGR